MTEKLQTKLLRQRQRCGDTVVVRTADSRHSSPRQGPPPAGASIPPRSKPPRASQMSPQSLWGALEELRRDHSDALAKILDLQRAAGLPDVPTVPRAVQSLSPRGQLAVKELQRAATFFRERASPWSPRACPPGRRRRSRGTSGARAARTS